MIDRQTTGIEPVTRHLRVAWPTERASGFPDGTVRILAVSDEVDRALESQVNRDALGRIDLVVGAGDLDPAYLALLGDAFKAPLVYVRGNHDRGANWEAHRRFLPDELRDAHAETLAGVRLLGLSWPGPDSGRADHDDGAAWGQVLGTGIRAMVRRGPRLVISHAPPLQAGDDPADPYHRGFRAYRWLAKRLRPTLWLHGHTTVATSQSRIVELGPTTFVNVTGSTLVELVPASWKGARQDANGTATSAAGHTPSTSSLPGAPDSDDAQPADRKAGDPRPADLPAAYRPASDLRKRLESVDAAEAEPVASAGARPLR